MLRRETQRQGRERRNEIRPLHLAAAQPFFELRYFVNIVGNTAGMVEQLPDRDLAAGPT